MIVFDSSTLILLAKCELLDIFIRDYKGQATIPKAVQHECLEKRTFDALLIEKRLEEGKIEVNETKSVERVEQVKMDFNLGRGEAEAVVLAEELGAKAVATDDRNAIKACVIIGLRFTTAMDILVRAAEKRLLGEDETEMKMRSLLQFGRYGKSIVADARKRLEVGKCKK